MTPVNGHLLIEPVSHETFVATAKDFFEEIGVVLDYDHKSPDISVKPGDKVYFDSWLAAKYPAKEDGKFYWLVEWQHIRAVEHVR